MPGLLRVLLVFALVALMVVFARPEPRHVTLGLLIVLPGEALRVWSAGYLLKTRELVTAGPYRYTRNPLYLGRLAIFTGLCVMTQLPYHAGWAVLLLGYAVFFGYYLPRKERVEPARLLELHGEAYARYRADVPALLPSWRPYRHASGQGWSSDRMLRNREHWMLTGLTAVTLFLYWRAYVG